MRLRVRCATNCRKSGASITHKFNIGATEGYITVGLYPNGEPGELFITMAKEGSTVSGLMDSFALAVSISLQHGVPLKLFLRKICPHPLRAQRLDQQSRHRLRQGRSWITSSAGSSCDLPASSNCCSRICGRSCPWPVAR